MLENLVSVRCDPCHPSISDSLVNSLRSYIDSVPDYERRTSEFITEVRRRLYVIHENNSQVVKQTSIYPRTKKFDQLLIKYVELEFEVLYLTKPQKQSEVIAELRVLRLLQVMLCKAVLKNDTLVDKNADALLRKTVLELLGQVKSTYLAENKLVYNIINKLKKANGELSYTPPNLQDVHKNLATSDYGTDDDSDVENDTFTTASSDSGVACKEPTSDCMEVPLTVNGASSVPTIEFADDDDDNYMVYLQKQLLENRMFANYKKFRATNATLSGENSKVPFTANLSSERVTNLLADKVDGCIQDSTCLELNDESACIVVCSDSDDEETEPSANKHKTFRKRHDKKSDKGGDVRLIPQRKAVVTFEIIDNDDDDDNETNYMVYLHKEVESNRTSRNCRRRNSDSSKEIIISDSEDEAAVENSDKTDSDQMIIDDNEHMGESNMPVQSKSNDELSNVEVSTSHNTESNVSQDADYTENRTLNQDFFNCNFTKEPTEEETQTMNIINFENEIDLHTFENTKTNFLINPAIVFEKMPSIELAEEFLLKANAMSEIDSCSHTSVAACFDYELGTEKPISLGGPVLSEKIDDLDVDNLLECRLNDSLLEEILLNDSYLLESQKEFEDLECFLFEDKKDPRINMTNFLVENDEILQTEVKNLKQTELTEAQSFSEQTNKYLFESTKNCHSVRKNRGGKPAPKARGYNKRCRNVSKPNPLKDFTNNNHQTGKMTNGYCDLGLGKQFKYCKNRRENSFKTMCRNKSNVGSQR